MKRGDLAKAERAARKVEWRYADILADRGLTLDIKRHGARELAQAMKLTHRHEKISGDEIWARRRAGMAF